MTDLTPQPKALELAYALACAARTLLLAGQNDSVVEDMAKSSEELRRQHAEIERLNQWADKFTDAHLKERQTGDALLKEIAAERDSLRAEVERLQSEKQMAVLEALTLDGQSIELQAEVERLRANAERGALLYEQMLDALRSAVLALAGVNSMYNDCCAREYLKVSNAIAAAREAKG